MSVSCKLLLKCSQLQGFLQEVLAWQLQHLIWVWLWVHIGHLRYILDFNYHVNRKSDWWNKLYKFFNLSIILEIIFWKIRINLCIIKTSVCNEEKLESWYAITVNSAKLGNLLSKQIYYNENWQKILFWKTYKLFSFI